MTGTIVAWAGSWSCISNHQSPVFISQYNWQPSESVRPTSSKSRCPHIGRCVRQNCLQLKISLQYNVQKICEWSWIQLSLPMPKSSLERRYCRASADCNDSILKLSGGLHRCSSIHLFVCWVNYWMWQKSCADRNRCHRFNSSEYLQYLLYNPVALVYASPPAFSNATTCLWAFVFLVSKVHVRSGFWGCMVSSLGVSLGGGGVPGSLSMGGSFVD